MRSIRPRPLLTQRPPSPAEREKGICARRFLQLRPFPVRLRRFHGGLNEGEAFYAVVDGWEVNAFGEFLLRTGGFDRFGDFAVDIGEAFEIALGVAGGNARDAAGRDAGIRAAARDDARRLAERRP